MIIFLQPYITQQVSFMEQFNFLAFGIKGSDAQPYAGHAAAYRDTFIPIRVTHQCPGNACYCPHHNGCHGKPRSSFGIQRLHVFD